MKTITTGTSTPQPTSGTSQPVVSSGTAAAAQMVIHVPRVETAGFGLLLLAALLLALLPMKLQQLRVAR